MEILDVGSGIKKHGNILLEGENVFHVDIDKNAFHVEVVCDIHHLPFKDSSFYIVHASHILEHVNSPFYSLKELKRVSKKWVIVKVPDGSWYRFMLNPEESSGHIYSWNSCTFRHLMQKHFPYVKIKSTKRQLTSNIKQSKLKTLKLMFLIWLISRNELTAICRKSD